MNQNYRSTITPLTTITITSERSARCSFMGEHELILRAPTADSLKRFIESAWRDLRTAGLPPLIVYDLEDADEVDELIGRAKPLDVSASVVRQCAAPSPAESSTPSTWPALEPSSTAG